MAYYLYDPGDSYTPYDDLDTAMAAARDLIKIYRGDCDPEWPEYVDGIAIYESDDPEEPSEGKLIARSVTCNVVTRPDDIDEDGYSPSLGLSFSCVDHYCDYKMELANA